MSLHLSQRSSRIHLCAIMCALFISKIGFYGVYPSSNQQYSLALARESEKNLHPLEEEIAEMKSINEKLERLSFGNERERGKMRSKISIHHSKLALEQSLSEKSASNVPVLNEGDHDLHHSSPTNAADLVKKSIERSSMSFQQNIEDELHFASNSDQHSKSIHSALHSESKMDFRPVSTSSVQRQVKSKRNFLASTLSLPQKNNSQLIDHVPFYDNLQTLVDRAHFSEQRALRERETLSTNTWALLLANLLIAACAGTALGVISEKDRIRRSHSTNASQASAQAPISSTGPTEKPSPYGAPTSTEADQLASPTSSGPGVAAGGNTRAWSGSGGACGRLLSPLAVSVCQYTLAAMLLLVALDYACGYRLAL